MWNTRLRTSPEPPPVAKGALINGTMKDSKRAGAYADVVIERGNTYRLLLINTIGWHVKSGFGNQHGEREPEIRTIHTSGLMKFENELQGMEEMAKISERSQISWFGFVTLLPTSTASSRSS
ncbi:hypothetical protein HYALB_00013561 [Hymenoscyphus albidus]|uniref:Uncharacterized protein n=1 Tax=Hymenoscyphus albidus TaxID=595503 RepID=A0A9N9LXX1_9HELO|nr:hypothetical protein HYALB_00013561 [Hymenoscyphus albidus]